MAETLFDELKRYVGFSAADATALQGLHPVLAPHFQTIAEIFYDRILTHDEARKALEGGESQVGRLKVSLVAWMNTLFQGPYDDAYYELRARIGRVHVRIALPQHYMFGAMNVLRREMGVRIDRSLNAGSAEAVLARSALAKILDLELAIMLHTYREDLLAQQARVERLSTFGQLVGSIGHELRNPLGVIETSLYILRSRVANDEKALKHVERIGEQVTMANSIITQLLDMIRDRPLVQRRVTLAPIVEKAVASVIRPGEVNISVENVANLPTVNGDAVQIQQVLFNLIDNAAMAVSPAGQVKVLGAVADDKVEISVEDTGPGVDPSIQARLFEPLVTTKPKGIGLGLALVRRIAERHGGSVSYERAATGGARFTLCLPRGA